MAESTAQHVITANNSSGQAEFHTLPKQPLVRQLPFGSQMLFYSNPTFPIDMSVTARSDLETTAEDSQTGLTNKRIVVDNGLACVFQRLGPGVQSPMHRTRTVDIGLMLEGEIELHLDNGDFRTLKKGDTFIQRGTKHKWVNKTDQYVEFFVTAIDAAPILDAQGVEMPEEGLS